MSVPIEHYAVLGDGRSAALVALDGAVDWLCWPRFDSPALFASLLDRSAGRFQVSPAGVTSVRRRYVDESFVLETAFLTPQGSILLTDAMTVVSESDKRLHPVAEHELLRLAQCLEGEIDLHVSFEPRPEFFSRVFTMTDAGPLFGIRTPHRSGELVLRSDPRLHLSGQGKAQRVFHLRRGERACFSLSFSSEAPGVLPPLGDAAEERLRRTAAWWKEWARRCRFEGPYREAVVRSALVVKLLGYAPSGAIVAAPTTSLPESIGRDLNWDYRFCWLRDAAFTARALFVRP